MSNFGTLLTVALAVLTISTTAGLGLVIGRVKGLTQRADSADAEAVSLRARVVDRDEQIVDLTAELREAKADSTRKILALQVESDTRVAQLERDLEAIGRVVTNEAHIVALQHLLEDHHAVATKGIADIEKTLIEIRDALRSPGE